MKYSKNKMGCYNKLLELKEELLKETNISFSGGKDSSAMLLRMLELGENIDNIYFCDTGLEFPEMYDYVNKVNNYIKHKYNKEITTIKPNDTFFKWFYGKWTRGKHEGKIRGFPRQHTHAYCCRELKIKPQNIVRSKLGVVCLGIAYDEKRRIQKDKTIRYPLIEWKWKERDCLMYLKKIDILNPLYNKFKRTGCWLCPKQPLASLKVLYNDYPKYWKILKKLEIESPHGFRADYTLNELEIKFNKDKFQTKLK